MASAKASAGMASAKASAGTAPAKAAAGAAPKAAAGAAPKAAAKAPKAAPRPVPESGPMGHVFGIRHFSPMGAYHLARFLDEVDPTAVLIEGPSDATHLVPHFAHKKTKPPIAILAFTKERPVRSILFPMAAYSPEWVAASWALSKKRLVRLMDLPASAFLGLQAAEEQKRDRERAEAPGKGEPGGQAGPGGGGAPADALDGGEPRPTEAETSSQAYLDDPYEEIARLSGDPDHETWWERVFEHSTEPGSYRDSIYEFGAGLRALRDESTLEKRETLTREAFMRRVIRETVAAGHDPDKIVVVCGAFHSPALRWEVEPMSDAEHGKLPLLETTLALMPYSYVRLSSQSGYGAGNHAPAYYQALWEEASRQGIERLPARYLAQIAGLLRKAGTVRSSAEVIEAVRLARTVAAIGGDRCAPTLRDLRDAAVTLLGHGDQGVIARHLQDIEVGVEVGATPPGVARTSIQDDFHRQIEDLGLKPYLKDKAEIVKGSTNKEWLDLRENRFAKSNDLAFRDRRRSVLFHRLAVMAERTTQERRKHRAERGLDPDGADGATAFAQLEEAANSAESTYKECWRAQWTPSMEVDLAENSLRGDSIETAVIRCFAEMLGEAEGVGDAAELARKAAKCNLPDAMRLAVARVQALAVSDAGLASVAKAVSELSRLVRYRDVTEVDVEPLKPLVAQLFLRAILLAPPAARASDDAAAAVARSLTLVHEVAGFDDWGDLLPIDRWHATLDGITDDELASPRVAGAALALLIEAGRAADDAIDRRVAKRISPGMPPGSVAGYFEGLASRNRMALLSRRKLWSSLTDFLEGLDDRAFRRSLPGLRRAFSGFDPGEARRVVTILGEYWGGGTAELLAAVETKIDADEEKRLGEDLAGLEDLGL
ncbi:MAG TPA: DUF5682 family protein [Polyangiaceae bacterium]|nr:DUF5682 family protein [Polyangiaceae bacterium]